jgi:hypothetical protein
MSGRKLWKEEKRALLERDEVAWADQTELTTLNDNRFKEGTVVMTGGTEEQREELYQILEREQTAIKQWYVNAEMLSLVILMVVVNFVRGTKSQASIVGIDQCSSAGWGVVLVFTLVCGLVSFKNLKQLWHEQSIKQLFDQGLAKSDLVLEGSTTVKLLSGAFLGSWIGVTFGLGGGIVFNPV